jgi:hypothetical protein
MLFARESAVYALTPATDLSAKRGYTVTIAGDVATLSASSTVPARGVILNGEPTTGKASIGILGQIPPVVMKCGGTITKGDLVQQNNDGTILTDAAAGARVVIGVAMESGVIGELIEVSTRTPLIGS